MSRSAWRDFRAYLPGFAFIVVLVGALALAPSVVPEPVRDLFGLGSHRLLPVVPVSTSGSYRFEATQGHGSDDPVGYDPCKTLEIRINPKGAPRGYLSMIESVLSEVSAATGLRLEYVGTSSDRPGWDNASVPSYLGEPRRSPALVSWATEDEVPQLAGHVAGLGGSLWVSGPDGRRRFVTGSVTLDAALFRQFNRTKNGRVQARAIVLHEFGHLVGLAHVSDRRELMYAANIGQRDYGPGDREGLALVGATDCA